MALEVYLYFDGNAKDAVEFYAQIFDAPKTHIATYAEMPGDSAMPLPENAKDLVMNTSLLIQGTTVMFSDVYPESGMTEFNKGSNVALVISDPKEEIIRNLFDQLKDGGTVISALEETFWSPLYGRVCDKFGIYWEIMVYDSQAEG